MSAEQQGRGPIVASEDEARGNVEWAAGVEWGSMIKATWPVRPILDLCVLVRAHEARIDALERKIRDHLATVDTDAHPPF